MSRLVALDARLAAGRAAGDSTYWTGLLHGLAEIDSSTRYLLYSNQPKPNGIPESERFSWKTLPSGSPRWWSLVRFPLAARRAGARVLHTQYNLSPLAGRRGVTTIHDVSFFIGPQWFRPRDRFLLRRMIPGSARRAARVITVSETSKSEIERFIPAAKGKTVVALNGPNPAIVPLPMNEAAEVVEGLGVARPYVMTVGTRWPRKNMALAIEACERLPDNLPHRLAVTGKPGWSEAPPGRRTVSTGYVSERELSALYSAADLYLAPSHHEGFGIPILEAFVCGCPVLCSRGGALPEVAGDAAVVENTWEPPSWSETISSLLLDSSKLDAMRERGRRRSQDFSWIQSAKIHERVYAEVAG